MKNYQKFLLTTTLLAVALTGCGGIEGQKALEEAVASGNCTELMPLADGAIQLPPGFIVHETDGVAAGGTNSIPYKKFESMREGLEKLIKVNLERLIGFVPNLKNNLYQL